MLDMTFQQILEAAGFKPYSYVGRFAKPGKNCLAVRPNESDLTFAIRLIRYVNNYAATGAYDVIDKVLTILETTKMDRLENLVWPDQSFVAPMKEEAFPIGKPYGMCGAEFPLGPMTILCNLQAGHQGDHRSVAHIWPRYGG